MPVKKVTSNLKIEKPEADDNLWEESFWRLASIIDLWFTQLAKGHTVTSGGNLTLNVTAVDLDATEVAFAGGGTFSLGAQTAIALLATGNTYVVYVDNLGALQVSTLSASGLWSGSLPSDFVLMGLVYEVETVWTIHSAPLNLGRGKAQGVAALDGTGHVPISELSGFDNNALPASLARLAGAFAPHEQSTPDMTVRVDAGFVLTATGITEVAAASTGAITAPATNPRIDRVVIDVGDGSISVITGTEAPSPVTPAIPAGKAPCCQILLDNSPATTAITNSLITDERAVLNYGLDPHTATITLADAAVSLTVAHVGKRLLMMPTATRVITLPTTGIVAGDIIEIHNLATAQKITLDASGGGDIATFQNGSMRLMALQATPTTAAHWRILDVFGGAAPSFAASKNDAQSFSDNTWAKLNVDDEAEDTNGNYASSRFTPTVPGIYQVNAGDEFSIASLAGVVKCAIRKNGVQTIPTIEFRNEKGGTVGNSWGAVISGSIKMDGLTDYLEVWSFQATTTPASRSTTANNLRNFFSGHRVGN